VSKRDAGHPDGFTVLHHAAMRSKAIVMRTLVSNTPACDVNTRDTLGEPLIFCCVRCDDDSGGGDSITKRVWKTKDSLCGHHSWLPRRRGSAKTVKLLLSRENLRCFWPLEIALRGLPSSPCLLGQESMPNSATGGWNSAGPGSELQRIEYSRTCASLPTSAAATGGPELLL
jgi:hypothetical protein